jgi:hypothetical protein
MRFESLAPLLPLPPPPAEGETQHARTPSPPHMPRLQRDPGAERLPLSPPARPRDTRKRSRSPDDAEQGGETQRDAEPEDPRARHAAQHAEPRADDDMPWVSTFLDLSLPCLSRCNPDTHACTITLAPVPDT